MGSPSLDEWQTAPTTSYAYDAGIVNLFRTKITGRDEDETFY
jgi:hypothetical protein